MNKLNIQLFSVILFFGDISQRWRQTVSGRKRKSNMNSLKILAASTTRLQAISSSISRRQLATAATGVKQPLLKEFQIYRWVQ